MGRLGSRHDLPTVPAGEHPPPSPRDPGDDRGEALPLVVGAVKEFRRLQNHTRPAFILLCAGTTDLSAGRIDEAASHAREALALTRGLGARGSEAHALCLAGDIASTGGAEDAPGYYREALALAGELGMRPLIAHSHLGLGKLDRRAGKREQARDHLATATTMYREMDMRHWREQAEAELRQCDDSATGRSGA